VARKADIRQNDQVCQVSNQYPRALDIGRPFRAAGIAVAIGGFHVSGCLSMLDGRAVDIDVCHEEIRSVAKALNRMQSINLIVSCLQFRSREA
jgi:hypothetical protein